MRQRGQHAILSHKETAASVRSIHMRKQEQDLSVPAVCDSDVPASGSQAGIFLTPAMPMAVSIGVVCPQRSEERLAHGNCILLGTPRPCDCQRFKDKHTMHGRPGSERGGPSPSLPADLSMKDYENG